MGKRERRLYADGRNTPTRAVAAEFKRLRNPETFARYGTYCFEPAMMHSISFFSRIGGKVAGGQAAVRRLER